MTRSDWPSKYSAIALSILLTLLTVNATDLPIAGANSEQSLIVGGFPMSLATQFASLEGQDWTLARWEENNQTVDVVGTSPTIQFSGQEVSGLGGCNRYRAQYFQHDSEGIEIGDIVSTRMACANRGWMEQERRYLNALRTAQRIQFNANQLTVAYRLPSGQPGQLFFSAPSTLSNLPVSQALKDSAWTLERWQIGDVNQPLVQNTQVTLAFSADRVSGSGGCNRFGGTYQQQG
ncbi:MAG: META domain-containing protein, partial [Thermosynechococcaceae cyanobacterium]